MTQVSHQIDLLVWLCGLPSALQAFCSIGRERDIKVENEATVVMEYPRGATGQFVASSRECPGSQPSGNHRKPWTGGSGKLTAF